MENSLKSSYSEASFKIYSLPPLEILYICSAVGCEFILYLYIFIVVVLNFHL